MSLWRLREAVGRLRGPGRRVVLGRAGAGRRGADHADFAALLDRFVDPDGRVHYAAWRRDTGARRALDAYLNQLGGGEPTGRDDRIAFWVNAYNAAIVASVLHDETAGCNCRRGWAGFNQYRDVRLWAAGRLWSPDRIEHTLLRPLGEPLVHFALVCGARSCPPLRVYTGAGLAYGLGSNARRFFARPDAFRYERATRTVHLSKLLKWYGRDFAVSRIGVLTAILPYLPRDGDWLANGPARVKYLPYDWSLNTADRGCPIN